MTTITAWIMIGTSLIWIIWDIFVYWMISKGKNYKTISTIITEFSWYTPILPFIAGLLAGHWFWPQ